MVPSLVTEHRYCLFRSGPGSFFFSDPGRSSAHERFVFPLVSDCNKVSSDLTDGKAGGWKNPIGIGGIWHGPVPGEPYGNFGGIPETYVHLTGIALPSTNNYISDMWRLL
jgi:hypothetical protein